MKTGKMVNRGQFEASYHKGPAVQEFVHEIVSEYNLPLDKEEPEYKKFCWQVLQMLYRLDQQKSQYKEQELYGGGYSAPSNTINNNQKNKLPRKTIREVVDLYAEFKIKIDKSWSKPLTAKGYTENLNRIADMFEYISPEFPVFL